MVRSFGSKEYIKEMKIADSVVLSMFEFACIESVHCELSTLGLRRCVSAELLGVCDSLFLLNQSIN